ncbi:putative gentisate 1,2-dioxygenase [Microdochium trichocladiopsis]|uniref:Gentisate 1,2-dioxygenase n=1 Tax=Microdochium trichocladiopsis TaxID=1682393 RepID=A0A9P8YD27_9PEZI|nr:putative gentisate 1,2-dioxygenase [Microdochium trichocladiopsis]KAH7039587.1 putative gentisate 1,2-dioxygenase [Microdochium trichocladiopsis]
MATQTLPTPAVVADSADKLVRDLEGSATLPLWAQMAKLNPALPNPRCTPHVWRYDEVRPYLLRAGQVVSEKQAERRVLMLVNPGRNEAPYTTDTIYGGLQLVMPNETAAAHRHVAFAMRFIIEGNGGFTAVHGRRVQMNRGDVILTPRWNWHDHGKDGSGPMIWLDGLDLPQFRHFPVHFVEHFKDPRYPAEDIDTDASPIVFKWHKMQARLDAQAGDWASQRYTRNDGSEVSKTLGAAAERVTAGKSSPIRQETASSMYHVVSGSGRTIIYGPDNEEEKLTWKRNDTFCIPTWARFQHFADCADGAGGAGDVYLFRCDDVPMITSLGFYRTSEDDAEGLVSH